MNIIEKFNKTFEELNNNSNLTLKKDSEAWAYTQAEKGYILNESVDKKWMDLLLSRCSFKIPDILTDIWKMCDGFYMSFSYTDEDFDKELSFGFLPITEAFGGMRDLEYLNDFNDPKEPLRWFSLSPDLFEDGKYDAYIEPEKVDIETLFSNIILIEDFSVDLYYFTFYDLSEISEEKLYITLENGPQPLKLNLEQYFEVMFEFKGIVFPWPILFIDTKNTNERVVKEINENIEFAKKQASKLKLNINFEKYGY